jgi:WD40 repeat protein
VAVAITNGDVQIVDPSTANCNVQKVLPNAGYPVAFSRDAATLLTLTTDAKTVQRWNFTSGALVSTTALNSANAPWQVSATTPDGDRLALTTGDLVEVYETRAGRCRASFKSPSSIASLEFSSDGQLLAIGGFKAGMVWDIAAGRIVRTLVGHNDRVSSIRFSPDQKMIATTSWDKTVRLWDTVTGKELKLLTGHKAEVLNGVFSPDGRTLVTASEDRTVRFWNVTASREVASFQVNYTPFCYTFSPDGQILMANYGEDGIRCWRAPSLAKIDAAELKERAEGKQP